MSVFDVELSPEEEEVIRRELRKAMDLVAILGFLLGFVLGAIIF